MLRPLQLCLAASPAKAAASRRTPKGPRLYGVRELAPAFFTQTFCRSKIL
jgi:hypothetical protein